jgi:hypothetical protein
MANCPRRAMPRCGSTCARSETRQTSPFRTPKGVNRGPHGLSPAKRVFLGSAEGGHDPPSWTPGHAGAVMGGRRPRPRCGSTSRGCEKAFVNQRAQRRREQVGQLGQNGPATVPVRVNHDELGRIGVYVPERSFCSDSRSHFLLGPSATGALDRPARALCSAHGERVGEYTEAQLPSD